MEEVSKLNVEQLGAVKEQVEAELNVLQNSVNSIRTAANRFEMAANALQNLSAQKQGQKMLVPLTASLYVPGELENVDKVLVDVGTGYYIEKSVPDGADYCDRKIKFLKANHDKLVEVANEKKGTAEQVSLVLNAKMRTQMSNDQQVVYPESAKITVQSITYEVFTSGRKNRSVWTLTVLLAISSEAKGRVKC